MFPKWFDKWNSDNPTNIFGPAILVGTAGGAVFLAAMIVAWGQPFATASQQTGPRGTGMHVQEFVSDLEAGDPTLADYYEDEPFYPQEGEDLAGDIYENVQVLGNLTDANFNRLMNAITLWVAPDEGCAYCHAGAAEGNYADDDLYTKVVARSMIQMTQNINQNWAAHVQANAEVGVTCYSCHRGQPVPNNVWFEIGPVNSNVAGWPAIQNRVTMTSNFTSLPSTYLEHFLLQDEDGFYGVAQVHDLASRVENLPGDPLIQQTEMTYAWMNYFSNSLGVNCVFCHNSRAFYDPSQVTPQWATASLGIIMVQEQLEQYILPLESVLPEERLGPVYADVPKLACRTCHQGYQQPLNGLNVIRNWPELAVLDDEPDYSAFE